MSPAKLLGLGLALNLAGGCEQDPRAPLDLDEIIDHDGDCVQVMHERLEPGGGLAVHRYLADGPSSPGGWALVTLVSGLEQGELGLIRLPATPEELDTAPVLLGQPELTATAIELRSGPSPGELWVLQDAGSPATVRKLVPELGVVAANGSLANFPAQAGTGEGCTQEFHRQLVMIDGRPHVLALPRCSSSASLDLHLLELTSDSATFLSTWVLGFDPSAGDFNCLLNETCTIGPIGPGESTQVANAERVAVGFTQVRDFGRGQTSSDISLLDLRLTPTGPAASLITFREVWLTPTQLGLVHVGQDPFSIHVHVRNHLDPGDGSRDAALLRFDPLGELYLQLKVLLPFEGAGRMVQLDSQAVMLNVADQALHAIPLVDVGSWPAWQPRVLLELDGLVDFEPAGVGQLLLHRAQQPAQVVQLRCLSPS